MSSQYPLSNEHTSSVPHISNSLGSNSKYVHWPHSIDLSMIYFAICFNGPLTVPYDFYIFSNLISWHWLTVYGATTWVTDRSKCHNNRRIQIITIHCRVPRVPWIPKSYTLQFPIRTPVQSSIDIQAPVPVSLRRTRALTLIMQLYMTRTNVSHQIRPTVILSDPMDHLHHKEQWWQFLVSRILRRIHFPTIHTGRMVLKWVQCLKWIMVHYRNLMDTIPHNLYIQYLQIFPIRNKGWHQKKDTFLRVYSLLFYL